MFSAWRPLPATVRGLAQVELCPIAYQQEELHRFRLCWAQPSAVHAEFLDPGARVYTYVPKETRARWNDRYHHWMVSEWRAALLPYLQPQPEVRDSDRVWLSEYTQSLERCLADPAWLSKVADYPFRNPSG